MTITLNKGQNISLDKSNFPFAFHVGLGWDTNQTDTGLDFDLDASVILLNNSGKIISTTDTSGLLYYNNLTLPGLKHQGDNRTGDGDGDDEVIEVDLTKLNSQVERLIIAVTIFQARQRKQTFGQVENAFVRLINPINGVELLRYDLSEDFSSETAVNFAEIYIHNGEWKMKAIGAGYNGGLSALLGRYGLNVPEEI